MTTDQMNSELASAASSEVAASTEMNALDAQAELVTDEVTDVEAKPARPASRLVGAVQDGCYNIGVVRSEDFAEDGTFSIPTALVYTNIDSAIEALNEVLTHAKGVREQLVYQQGVAEGLAQAAAAAQAEKPEVVMDTSVVKSTDTQDTSTTFRAVPTEQVGNGSAQ